MRRLVLALALLLLALLVGACSGGGDSGKPAASASSSVTASTAARPTDVALVLSRDTRLLTQAPGGPEHELLRASQGTLLGFPLWSPDGSRIAYTEQRPFTGAPNADWGDDILVAPAAGGTPRAVRPHARPGEQVQGMSWTPDGKALIFGFLFTDVQNNKVVGQVRRIDRIDIESGQTTTVIDNGYYPSAARDGSRMAFLRQMPGNPNEMWVAALDGSDARPAMDQAVRFQALLSPRMAPDGKSVAFSAATDSVDAAPPGSGGGGLLGLLGFLAPRRAEAHGVPLDVWRLDLADGSFKRLTNFAEDDPRLAWTPDGTRIFAMATGGLYEIDARGGGATKVGAGSFDGQIDVRT